MPPVVAFAVAGFRRYAAYRLATAAGAFSNSVFGLLRVSLILAAIDTAGGSIGGYDVGTAAAYAWITQALIAPVQVFTWNDVAARVRTGDIAVDLARPVDLQLQFLAADLGRAAYVLLPRGLPPLIVGAVTIGFPMPRSPWPYLVGLLSVALGVLISFACRFTLNLVAFWLMDIRGLLNCYVVVTSLLCGLFVPVAWFPPWLARIAAATPFPSMVQAPADLLTGRVTGASAAGVLVTQVAWLAVTLLAGRLVLRRATHRLVVQGG